MINNNFEDGDIDKIPHNKDIEDDPLLKDLWKFHKIKVKSFCKQIDDSICREIKSESEDKE